MSKQRKGFTLIELLVVISIIALLMSIMMPALGQVKKLAQATICFSNLRHWGIVWKMFADDNKDKFPGDQEWFVALRPYYKDTKILLCPSAKKRGNHIDNWGDYLGDQTHAWEGEVEFVDGQPERLRLSYGLNYWAGAGASGDDYIKKWMWTGPTLKGVFRAPLICDCSKNGFAPLPSDTPPTYDGEPYWGGTNLDELRAACVNRHPNGTVNALFGDFAARKVGLKQLWYLKWYRFWPGDGRGGLIPLPAEWPDWMEKFTDEPMAY